MQNEITIEALESLAASLATDDTATRNKLARLIAAYARIAYAANPGAFRRRATHEGDESGHWDNSYPPSQVCSDYTGPLSIVVADATTEDIATSGGYYHTWRRVTKTGALAVGIDGTVYRSDESGTGAVGQYAAHPGDHNVDVTIDWSRVRVADPEAITLAELSACEAKLREIAFPLVAARLATQESARS